MRDLLGLAGSLAYMDEIYDRLQADPGSVDPSWAQALAAPPPPRPTPPGPAPAPAAGPGGIERAIGGLVHAYRERGHLAAHLDPLGLTEPAQVAELAPSFHGIGDRDLDTQLDAGISGLGVAPVREAIARLRHTYSSTVGVEFAHIDSQAKRAWLWERMERESRLIPPPALRRQLLSLLVKAEGFERFCHVKYPGTKRFSLEGSETLIPLLDQVIAHAARLGVRDAVLGLAHRGRLTALEMIMQQPARQLFAAFEDIEPEASLGGGDVKYHLGYSSDRTEPDGTQIHLSLAFNPSHLEAVDPVVLGRVRAKQRRHKDRAHRRVVGVLVHGDAAFAGQGLVAESLNLTALYGYRTGGTVHLIVNNQVGFTASPGESRSTLYCTDIAQMIQCPIWHVNGDDVDAVAQVVQMAMEYRAMFDSDVVIDLYCYRKYGHNEMDEPGFTQPLMYDRIQHKESVVASYGRRLVAEGVVSAADVEALVAARQSELQVELDAARAATQRPRAQAGGGLWRGFVGGPAGSVPDVDTGVPRDQLERISASTTRAPAGFTPHPKVVRLLEQRAQMGRGERLLDWGMAEMLAYGTLLAAGHNVRLTGQDVTRGTFSHRHAVITDVKTGARHPLLGNLHPEPYLPCIYDSPLSEAAILGFEFGYSLDYPETLVMWEAQFGDFVNGAQVIIDQFIVASEDKWNRLSGIVLLLPHGYEGQGPEHSSARLERFLTLCAEDNIQVCQPTTPAQMFHLLRRQVLRPWRKPLIVMTPKSLLRLPAATSGIDELTAGTYRRILDDPAVAPAQVTRLLLCSGRVYYDLVEERRRRQGDHPTVAIARLEELYPWSPTAIAELGARWARAGEVAWVQDEPANMGPAPFVIPRLEAALGRPVRCVARDVSASPATGSHHAHAIEQGRILASAFT